jgi:hypothetical protein
MCISSPDDMATALIPLAEYVELSLGRLTIKVHHTKAVKLKSFPKYIQSPVIQYYVGMINDRWRNNFFRDALIKHAPNKVVLDVGSGTGILAFYALASGAKFVYAVEINSQSAEVVYKILSKNFDSSRFKVLVGDFFVPEIDKYIEHTVDVLVSETIGPGLFDQGMLLTWQRAKQFLSTDAVCIPQSIGFDLWMWDGNIASSLDSFIPDKKSNIFFTEECLDSQFANSLLEIDQDYRDSETFPMSWIKVNQIPTQYTACYENKVVYDVNNLPTSKPTVKSNYIEPRSKIEFDFTITQPSTVIIGNKLMFENETIFLKDAKYMPWQYNPVFVLDQPGQYVCSYNNHERLYMPLNEWVCRFVK